MISRRAGCVLVLFFLSSVAVADVTGTWNGTISGPLLCSNGSSVVQTFTTELALLQSGNFVTGSLQAMGPDDACVAGSPTITRVIPITATISGSSFSGTYTGSGGGTHSFTATVNGSSMNLSVGTGDGGPLTGALTQTSTQPPASGLTGTYAGTYGETLIPCGKLAPIMFSGQVTLELVQAGNGVSGNVTATNTKRDHEDSSGNCTVTTDPNPETEVFSGVVNGNTITGFVSDGQKKHNVTATVSGNTISGTVTGDFPGESNMFTVTRSSSGTPAPAIASFTANPSTISAGDSATLTWSTINAASVSIDNGIGTQAASGSVNISPSQTTNYTLTATGPGGTTTATTTVTVTAGAPKIVIGALPSGMLQAAGASGATDSFTISNAGAAAGNVTLTQNGNFFTISPASFTIAPGASQIVGITASSQPAGTFDGTISISPAGIIVPVHLLVAAPPTAPVNPQPTAPRSDVSAPAGQNPSGSVQFKNNGTGGLTGIAVADVPWIVPQSGAINIAAGQTATVTFNIDRSQRPDGAAPNGGVSGKISLRYLTPAASKGLIALGNTPTGSVSVTIVDVVKPGTGPGSPQPLQSGEVALFIDGLRTANRFNGDLSISSRASVPSISDLQLFFTAGGNPTQLSAIPAFAPSAGVSFPAISKNVFGITGTGGGSLQVRSSQAASVALSAVVSLNDPNSAISSATALPILRSDRSIAAGDHLTFAGAQDSQTSVWIQEVSGNAGHISIQYLDANGAIVGIDSGDVPAFSAAGSAAVNGTRSIILTNDSTGSARFAGYAVINDPTTNDGWVLTDPLHQWGSASGPLIMPLVQTAPNDVYISNPSNTAAQVTLTTDVANRHHSVRPAGAGASQTMSIPPMSTSKTTLSASSGFVRLTSTSSVSAVGRVTMSAGGASFGSSLPAVPASAALASGQGKRFTGVDDSSARTVAAATPATYRSTLMLIEAAGESATVRVTLRYNFIAGATVSSQGVSSRDFSIGANQMLTIADLARSIIGAQRDAFGDLRNMQVDVDVTDGSGRVLPFIESVDNASGDIMVRTD